MPKLHLGSCLFNLSVNLGRLKFNNDFFGVWLKMLTNRYLTEIAEKKLQSKMLLLTGPRQCGKTTLSRQLFANLPDQEKLYLNWDITDDRRMILEGKLPNKCQYVIYDEIHKYARWRNYIKGAFDKLKDQTKILVTGSARLDLYRKSGESLQGRYYLLRMHGYSLKEVIDYRLGSLEDLFQFGGFPEPFLKKSLTETRIWSRDYRSRLVREDLRELENVKDIGTLELLSYRLPELVGSPLSINALREDLSLAHQTVARWIDIFERLYAIFRVYPFGAPSIRAVKKEAKHYHFDWTLIEDPGSRFENLVACHLLKWCHFCEDTEGWVQELRYFRDTDKREVDFVILRNRKPILFVECKLSDNKVSDSLRYLKAKFPKVEAVQVVYHANQDLRNKDDIRIVSAATFLNEFV
jgi:predicted AAA+ superfamily ATPase